MSKERRALETAAAALGEYCEHLDCAGYAEDVRDEPNEPTKYEEAVEALDAVNAVLASYRAEDAKITATREIARLAGRIQLEVTVPVLGRLAVGAVADPDESRTVCKDWHEVLLFVQGVKYGEAFDG